VRNWFQAFAFKCNLYRYSAGHQIGIIVAETQDIALEAARLVQVQYEELPALLSIDDAVAADSYHVYPMFTDHSIEDGDVDTAMAACEAAGNTVEGDARCGGQEHFYLEPMANLVWCGDNDEVHTVSSTQCPQKHQKLIAGALGLPCNKVVCKTKRLGGGFGGKETRAAFLNVCAAVPAFHLRKPVSLVLDRHVDMAVTGARHAFLGKYKVGYSREGKILALDMKLYNNAGNSLDLSAAIMDRALFHSDGAYKIPNVRVRGRCCKTHMPSNTAFRGFGGPQGVLFAEMWIDRVARKLGKTAEAVREINLYDEGETCHFGQVMESSQLKACWEQATGNFALAGRRAAAAAFNAAHKHRKRGIAATPVKFGISFTALFMNQAGALVHCYLDGTVLVTHGGVEMGQGLHTKMAQVCAQELGITTDLVYIAETSTDKVPNSSPTAASASSDLYGAAIADACKQLNERLAPIRAKLGPEASKDFAAVCNAAYFARVDLSAHGWYVTPDLVWEWDGSKGRPFNYFCFGAAVSEVEVDTLSGDVNLLRTDIVMDVGDSINPALDVGQVEGGFVQGMGWVALEVGLYTFNTV
jgi:xanthine dehydrogenase/oxidase